MSVEMKQKAGANVTPKDDAILYDFLIADSGVVEGCVASAIGGTQMKITSGRGVILGKWRGNACKIQLSGDHSRCGGNRCIFCTGV